MQQQPRSNFLLFIALTCLFFAAWLQMKIWFAAPKDQPKDRDNDDPVAARPEPPRELKRGVAALCGAAGPAAELLKPVARPVVEAPRSAPVTPDDQLIPLGVADPTARFNFAVKLDPRGAGVRSIVPNKFQAANEYGRPVWIDKKKGIEELLELVPADSNRDVPAYALYHFRSPDDDRPSDSLGQAAWKVVDRQLDEKTPDGRLLQRVAFQAEVQGVRITKTYTLAEGDYHLGLEVTLSRVDGEEGNRKLRYQLAGARGLPVEGVWYTSTFRNSLIGTVDASSGDVSRDLQTLQEIGHREGGSEIVRDGNRFIRYAAVGLQYFAAAIVVDEKQEKQDFLKQARPTLETGVARGAIKSIDRRLHTLTLTLSAKRDQAFVVTATNEDEFEKLRENGRIAVLYHIDPSGRFIVDRFGDEARTHPAWYEDITVRVATEPIDIKPGEPVVHKYLLYHGPVKPSLLGGLRGDRKVDPDLVNRYAHTLALNTMTDYQSPGVMGAFSSKIYWTQLIIKCTNLMHGVLGFLNWLVPSYGICIILLTVLVRGLMFPLSKKQALMGIKMQEMAPELKKLQEKYKDDRQAMGQAQMELYRKHGVNPFGTCWLLLLQMPVFMGLYFCLQESIQFRLAPFWPTWIVNLAAPDMMLWWGEGIPIISRPEDYGSLLYLGPFLNLLPIVAVVLMLVQQKMMTPPATDEQQAMQQAMMKYMMIFFGLMFYRVAAGLCIYFIASSAWGLAERKLLPKRHPVGSSGPIPSSDGPSTANSFKQKPTKRRTGERGRKDEEADNAMSRLRNWWTDVLRQAEKK